MSCRVAGRGRPAVGGRREGPAAARRGRRVGISPSPGVCDRRLDLATVTHDAGVGQQPLYFGSPKRATVSISNRERGAEVLALAQDRQPRQSGLERLEARRSYRPWSSRPAGPTPRRGRRCSRASSRPRGSGAEQRSRAPGRHREERRGGTEGDQHEEEGRAERPRTCPRRPGPTRRMASRSRMLDRWSSSRRTTRAGPSKGR